jgi:hypothetical protein
VNRTLHTYHKRLRILCEAFQIEFEGRDHHCERLLVQQAFGTLRRPTQGDGVYPQNLFPDASLHRHLSLGVSVGNCPVWSWAVSLVVVVAWL